jgi:hypothetical protein
MIEEVIGMGNVKLSPVSARRNCDFSRLNSEVI